MPSWADDYPSEEDRAVTGFGIADENVSENKQQLENEASGVSDENSFVYYVNVLEGVNKINGQF